MAGLLGSIIIFNVAAKKLITRLTVNQMVHIWLFTSLFQVMFDIFVALKYHGYWYFNKGVDWQAVFVYLSIVPPVNLIFLNFFPIKQKLTKQILYLLCWNIGILLYELFTLLPEPIGYFHYGWWRIWHSVILNPILLLILLTFYKIICRIEKKAFYNKEMQIK